MRRRNFPKGYAEMLEKQHNQLVGGLQEMYRRLRKASLWEGEQLDESSGRPLTHDILAALNFLEPQADGSDAEFIEQPRSSQVPDTNDGEDDDQKTLAEPGQDISQPTPHDQSIFFDCDAPAQTITSRSSSKAMSPTTLSPHQPLSRPKLQQSNIPTPSHHILPSPSLSVSTQPDLLGDDPVYAYDAFQEATSSDSSVDSTNTYLSSPAMLPPFTIQAQAGGPGFYADDISTHKKPYFAPRPSLCHNWPGNGVSFDSSDFMGDYHQFGPQETTLIELVRPMKIGLIY